MLTQKVIVDYEKGLHLRVASKIVETCRQYDSHVLLCKDCKHAEGCSVLDLLLLEAGKGTELNLVVEGHDEVNALAALAGVFSDGAGI